MADDRALEDAILPRIASRLEQALDLVSSVDAMERLQQAAELCREAETLARAAVVLARP